MSATCHRHVTDISNKVPQQSVYQPLHHQPLAQDGQLWNIFLIRVQLIQRREQFHRGVPTHQPHHHAEYAPNHPLTQDKACSMVIWQLHPSHLSGISCSELLYLSLTLSCHSSAESPVPLGKELKTYPDKAVYATQENAWMSKRMMFCVD